MPKMNCWHKTFLIVEITTKFPFLVGRRENDKNNKTSNAHVFRHSLALEAVKLVYCLRAINSSPVSIIFRRWRVQATVAVNGHKYVFLHIWIIIFRHLAKLLLVSIYIHPVLIVTSRCTASLYKWYYSDFLAT